MPAKTIHLVRHGQGYHQLDPVEESEQIPDAELTDDGTSNCKIFSSRFPHGGEIELVCASPLSRAIQTASLCFEKPIKDRNMTIILHPDAKEDSNKPMDTPQSAAALQKKFGSLVDAALVTDEATKTTGRYSCEPALVKARSRDLRLWLRARPERVIAVAGHGRIWAYVVGEMDDQGEQTGPYWQNRDWRTYEFDAEDDADAKLHETKESIARREDGNGNLSEPHSS